MAMVIALALVVMFVLFAPLLIVLTHTVVFVLMFGLVLYPQP